MAVAASSIINRVRTQLIDTGGSQRWTDAELILWIGDGERTIVSAVPWAYQKLTTMSLVAGTKQTLPSDGNSLIEIVRNLTGGGVPGAPCVMVDRAVLDRQYSDWHLAANANISVTAYTYDLNNPQVFYVFPYNTGGGSVEINYSVMPVDLVLTSDNIHVRDIFATALVDYVLFRAHQKDSDYAAGQALAANYLQSFMAFLQTQPGAAAK
jgi:hypothetical protein